MSEQEPETKNGFGHHVKHSVGDNLGININFAGAIGDTPDTAVL